MSTPQLSNPLKIASSRPLIFKKSAARDANEAMDQLFCVFPDHYPQLLSENNDEWAFQLMWPSDPLWYVDPSVAIHAQKLFGVALENIPSFYRVTRCGRADFVLSMFHSRALLAPTYAIRRLSGQPRLHIVHVDDHDDLMAPLLSASDPNDELFNSALGCHVKRCEPDSVNLAIDRGAISKGSFLTTYLLMNVPSGHLFYVRENTAKRRDLWLRPLPMNYSVGGVSFERTGVDFFETETTGAWHFSETKVLPREIECSINDRIWLDVDMDAFCNRYDGDSDNRFRTGAPDERVETLKRIESFLVQLASVRWLSKIEAVSVAISPSFFPSDYWTDAIPKICDGIETIVSKS